MDIAINVYRHNLYIRIRLYVTERDHILKQTTRAFVYSVRKVISLCSMLQHSQIRV